MPPKRLPQGNTEPPAQLEESTTEAEATADTALTAEERACVAPPSAFEQADTRAAKGVRYDAEQNTIVLSGAAPTTLAAVGAALDRPELLAELGGGEWLLSANLELRAGAELAISGPAVRWLKLRSDSEGFVSIKARGGRLTISDTCVSSWDPGQQKVDQELADGRSFVLARDGAWMGIYRSQLQYLGYAANESYGLAWRLEGTGGEIVESELAYNYYGLYTFEVADLLIRGNEVHHNIQYGIDPHTDSRGLIIEENTAHHNGKHGIILAEGCSDSIVRNNVVYNNILHGIVLYNDSDNNTVEGNTVYGNGQQGINLNNVRGNRIVGNAVYANTKDGIGVGQKATENLVINNIVRDNQAHGIYLYSDADKNTIEDNQISGNGRFGIYLKSAGNWITMGNEVFGNAIGVYARAEDLPRDAREQNRIYDNREADVKVGG